MKKILLASAIALFGLANAQEKGNFKVGAHIGIPTGKEFAEGYNFNLGVDVAYIHPIAEGFKLGATVGYSNYFGKTIEGEKIENLGIIPVAATAQYAFGDSNVFVGADLGYAFFTGEVSKVVTGGFYYQPKVGYTFDKKHDVTLSFKRFTTKVEGERVSGNSINLGYGFNF